MLFLMIQFAISIALPCRDVFISSVGMNGNFMGIGNADALCMNLASASGSIFQTEVIAGNVKFVAWIRYVCWFFILFKLNKLYFFWFTIHSYSTSIRDAKNVINASASDCFQTVSKQRIADNLSDLLMEV